MAGDGGAVLVRVTDSVAAAAAGAAALSTVEVAALVSLDCMCAVVGWCMLRTTVGGAALVATMSVSGSRLNAAGTVPSRGSA